MLFKNDKDSFLKLTISKLIAVIATLIEIIKQKENEEPEPINRLVKPILRKGIYYCQVQSVCSGNVAYYKPSEISSDTDLMMGFNKKDLLTINNLANFEKYKPKSKISTENHDENTLELKNLCNETEILDLKTLLRYDAKEEKHLNHLIENLSKKDAFELGKWIGEKENDIELVE